MTESPTPSNRNLRRVIVCQNDDCCRNGSQETLKAFQEAANLPDDVTVETSGCMGQCSIGPTVRILPDEVWYYRVSSEDVQQIVHRHLQGGEEVEEKLNPRIHMRFPI
ncbi:(2Fe-2S) ferredoxin domain-containing protein [Geitlerinema sp. PCC 9228]|uniref:NAD(P)H-dependent oxidoreductase subunit E n=1 Tax=Geitlerinema sp. PCC 9228 TaxID=111611 RepID=UPI0009FC63E5